jgi:hypothetical protein
VALLFASKVLAGLNPANSDQKVGIEIVRKAIQSPVRQIAENAGTDGSIVVGAAPLTAPRLSIVVLKKGLPGRDRTTEIRGAERLDVVAAIIRRKARDHRVGRQIGKNLHLDIKWRVVSLVVLSR